MENSTSTPSAPVVPKQKLTFSTLLNDSWELTGKKFWRLFGIYLMMTVLTVLVLICYLIAAGLVLLVLYFVHVPVLTALVASILLLGLIGAVLWISAWQIAAVYKYLAGGEEQTVLSLINEAQPIAKTILPTVILNFLVVLGGFMVFIIPGIIMSMSLAFVTIVAVLENRKMWDALMRSRDLVRGHWWNVFVQFVGLGLLIALALMVTGGQYSPLSLLLTPFIYIYSYLMYKQLASFNQQAAPAPRGDWYYKVAAVLAAVGIVIGVIGGGLAVAKNWDQVTTWFDEGYKEADTYEYLLEEESSYELDDSLVQ